MTGGASGDGVRLQKFLAEAGVASRRKAEELILAGRVKVNQQRVTQLGSRVDPDRDLVTVDGKLASRRDTKSYYLLYKPPGCVTTASDPEGRPTALEYLRGVKERVFSVGRLDYDAEGAVLFTDDGELSNRLAHPRYGHRRTYLVKVRGEPPPGALERMVSGVRLEDGPARALEAVPHERAEKNVWIRVVVGEGRFHLVKRLCEAVGLFVQRLYRPEFGGVTVEGLRPGQFRALTPVELRALKAAVGLGGGAPGAATAPPRDLPRAARRHGHGPPAPPEAPAPRGEGARGGGERAEAGERAARPEGGERRDRAERTGRPDRGDRAERVDRPDRGDRAERTNRPDRGDRRDRAGRADRPDRGDRSDRAERTGRPDRGDRRDRAGRTDRPERRDRPNPPEQSGRKDRRAQGAGERPPRGDAREGRGRTGAAGRREPRGGSRRGR
ncbi:pseudouridine synthase [Anaeromyxobacter terrae]|uniref:pseudouridine synthase n=1 Tax=Anaeromyxobacter terrae TaxID=2925406 RepID=UPI001F5878FE|nr:pseudouridine synthase [Anaeromyxobacter sp. SG22]